jgi:hypothetical protein
MKKTRRLRDWAFTNLLGIQMIKRGDVRGLLHINSLQEIVDCVARIEIPRSLLQERPVLRLANENSLELERYLKAEMEFWQKLDDLRLNLYTKAWKSYGTKIFEEKKSCLEWNFWNSIRNL